MSFDYYTIDDDCIHIVMHDEQGTEVLSIWTEGEEA